MTSLHRTIYSVGAVACMVASLLIVHAAGLPQRYHFTGQIWPDQRLTAPELHAFAPDFELVNTQGETIRLSELRGQPVIVNFWATWCDPCALEMPILQSVFEAGHSTILAVNMGEASAAVRAWQKTYGLTYDLLMDETQHVAALYHLRGQPSTYVISPAGVITAIFFGPVGEQALRAALNL